MSNYTVTYYLNCHMIFTLAVGECLDDIEAIRKADPFFKKHWAGKVDFNNIDIEVAWH